MTALTQWKMGAPVSATAAGTNAGVTASVASLATTTLVVTHVSGSGDAAATVTIEGPVGTVLWTKKFAAAFTFSETLPPGPYNGGVGGSIGVKISASTSACNANISGYQTL